MSKPEFKNHIAQILFMIGDLHNDWWNHRMEIYRWGSLYLPIGMFVFSNLHSLQIHSSTSPNWSFLAVTLNISSPLYQDGQLATTFFTVSVCVYRFWCKPNPAFKPKGLISQSTNGTNINDIAEKSLSMAFQYMYWFQPHPLCCILHGLCHPLFVQPFFTQR